MKIVSSFSPAIIALTEHSTDRAHVSFEKKIFPIINRCINLLSGSLNYYQHTHNVSEWHVWQ